MIFICNPTSDKLTAEVIRHEQEKELEEMEILRLQHEQAVDILSKEIIGE
ncbi:MAG: hypothetical protein ACOCZ5_02885 [bacterium]